MMKASLPETDICVIGGGASGLAAAIAARMGNPGAKITILEKNDEPGKKILATGNGRCNLSNRNCGTSSEVISLFHNLGIHTREEDQGRIYPYNGSAADVLRGLLDNLREARIQIITSFAADSVSLPEGSNSSRRFAIRPLREKTEIQTGKLLLATGGKAAPQFGCAGDGYRIAKSLGHSVSKTFPALVPIECVGDFSPLKGARSRAKATLLRKGEAIGEEIGEAQFTDYGLSGICVMNLSRFLRLDGNGFSDYTLSLDLMPEISFGEIASELNRKKGFMGQRPAADILLSLIPAPLRAIVLTRAGVSDSSKMISDLSGTQIGAIAGVVKNLTFQVKGAKGWKFAQCTSGGVPLSEIHPTTMESNLIPGLFFAGELIGYDGPCGGYNLHHAWHTGILAGKAMAANVQNP